MISYPDSQRSPRLNMCDLSPILTTFTNHCGVEFTHADDLTQSGTLQERHAVLACQWLNNQSHQYKIFIARHHDRALEEDPSFVVSLKDKYPGLLYFQETEVLVKI